MARVVAVRTKEATFAIALEVLRQKKTVIQSGITLAWQAGQASALDAREIAKGRDVGTVSAWKSGADGTVRPVPYDVTFAFVFHAFHPEQEIRTK